MTERLRLGIVGFGKIARDQHLPTILNSPEMELTAIASPNASVDGVGIEGVSLYLTLEQMLEASPDLDAVIMCQPPQFRFAAAQAALLAGKHVFLEKPPGSTVSEVEHLKFVAAERHLTLFAGWHSRCATAVARAKLWLAKVHVHGGAIRWREDVRHWHPNQDWIWAAGGMGVFDPGINALSILTEIMPEPVRVLESVLEIPANRHSPIAARLKLATSSGALIDVDFDWRQTGQQTWEIELDSDHGNLRLTDGGSRLAIDGQLEVTGIDQEYPALYHHFRELVRERRSDVDLTPLQLVADAFIVGRLSSTENFDY